MTSSKENLIPKFASTFQPLIDQEGYLANQKIFPVVKLLENL